MFINSGFAQKRSNGPLSASNPVPSAALPNIHEDTLQAIQGGAANDHYHITAAQRTSLLLLISNPKWTEVVCSNHAQVMFSLTGDAMHTIKGG